MKNVDHPEAPSGGVAPSQPAKTRPTEPRPPERWTVDGLEDSPAGPLARLEREDGSTFDLPLRLLPQGLREGDLLEVQDGPDGVTVQLLKTETTARREAMQTRLEALNSAEHGRAEHGSAEYRNSAEADQDGAEEITV